MCTLLLAAAPLVVLAGCGGSGSTASSASGPIAIGYKLPLTGTVALPGKQEQEGWNLGLKEFGQSVDGHRIVTYFEDTGTAPWKTCRSRPTRTSSRGARCPTAPGGKNSPPTRPAGPPPSRRQKGPGRVRNWSRRPQSQRAETGGWVVQGRGRVVRVGGDAAVLVNHRAARGGVMASCRIMMTGVSQRSGMIAMRER